MARYRQKSFVLGRTVQFTQQGVTMEGIAKDITNTGELVVETATERKVLSSGNQFGTVLMLQSCKSAC